MTALFLLYHLSVSDPFCRNKVNSPMFSAYQGQWSGINSHKMSGVLLQWILLKLLKKLTCFITNENMQFFIPGMVWCQHCCVRAHVCVCVCVCVSACMCVGVSACTWVFCLCVHAYMCYVCMGVSVPAHLLHKYVLCILFIYLSLFVVSCHCKVLGAHTQRWGIQWGCPEISPCVSQGQVQTQKFNSLSVTRMSRYAF